MEILSYPVYEIDGWQGNVRDDYGVDWVITGEEGWGQAVDARTSLVDIPNQDGADDSPTFESSRSITLTGTAVAQDWFAQNAAKDRLNGVAYTSRDLYTLRVTENHLTRVAFVRRSGAQKISDRAGNAFDFQLSLVAPDPRKYGFDAYILTTSMPGDATPIGRTYDRTYPMVYPPSLSYAAVVDARNDGNRDTGALISLSSGMDMPGIVNVDTGAVLQFNVSLGTNDTLDIDLAKRTVILNGTASRRGSLIAGSSWFLLQPGDNNLRMMGLPNGTGSPTMTVVFRSAWK